MLIRRAPSDPSQPIIESQLTTHMSFRHTMALPIPSLPPRPAEILSHPVKTEQEPKIDSPPGEIPDESMVEVSASSKNIPADQNKTLLDTTLPDVVMGGNGLDSKIILRQPPATENTPIPRSYPTPQQQPLVMTKEIVGEVRVCISKDCQHPFLSGHLYALTFHLIG